MLASVLTCLFPLPNFPPDGPLSPHSVSYWPPPCHPFLNTHLVQASDLIPSPQPMVLRPTHLLTLSGTGLRWAEAWIVPAKKVHQQGRQRLPRTSGTQRSRRKGRKGTSEEERGWMKVDTSSELGYHTVSESQRTKGESWLQWLYKKQWEWDTRQAEREKFDFWIKQGVSHPIF